MPRKPFAPHDCQCAYIAPELRYSSQICSACAKYYRVDRVTPEDWTPRVKSQLAKRAKLEAETEKQEQEEEKMGETLDRVRGELDDAQRRIRMLTTFNKNLEQRLKEATFMVSAAAYFATKTNVL